MPLNPQQTHVARMLYQLAVQHGVPPQRAREFVSASYAESGLRPGAVNRSSGATGLFQLLSPGYQQRARQLGGIRNPQANALAILPDYRRYWQQHPHAAPGEAGAAVERSGQGAGFYSRGLAQLGNLGGGPAGATASPGAPSAAPPPPGVSAAPDPRLALLQAFQPGPQHGNFSDLYAALEQQKQAQQAARTHVQGAIANLRAAGKPVTKGHLINELFYDPLGGIKNERQIGAIGHHGDHVHVSLATGQAQLAAIAHAKQMGLHVGEERGSDVHPVHVKDSYHYRTYGPQFGNLRQAADVSGSPAQMSAFYRWVRARY